MAEYDNLDVNLSPEMICRTVLTSFKQAKRNAAPYTYWNVSSVLPGQLAEDICQLPFDAPNLGGVSGKREKHNATRTYFDADNRAAFPVMDAVARVFQMPEMTRSIETQFGTSLAGSYLRMEYAQDTDGFWLEPHSDLGVKLFTMLLYLSDDPQHLELGTDIYRADKTYIGSVPFIANSGMIFVPSDITMHGFEPRSISGVRKSLIINYVTDEWNAREQLAFPDTPIAN